VLLFRRIMLGPAHRPTPLGQRRTHQEPWLGVPTAGAPKGLASTKSFANHYQCGIDDRAKQTAAADRIETEPPKNAALVRCRFYR
jgi:hypothetical protein